MKSKSTGKRPGMKLRLRVSARMSQRFQIVQRTSLIMLFAIVPFTVERIFNTENAIAHVLNNGLSASPSSISASKSQENTDVLPSQPQQGNKFQNVASMSTVETVNKGILYVNSNTIFHSEGTFTTLTSGSTTIKGNLYLKGNLVNNGTFTPSTGKVFFSGDSPQTITGTTDLYDAEVTKSSGNLTLNNAISVSNVLTLTQGNIDLNSNTLTLTNSATSALAYTGGYLLSENVNNTSKIQWNIGSTTGSHIIPFISATTAVIPLTLNLTAGTIGNVTVSTYHTSANNTPFPVTPVAVTSMNNLTGTDNSANVVDRFWQIDKSGASGTLTVTFTYANGEEPANGETSLVAQRYNNANGWNVPAGSQTFNATTNTVTTPALNSFGVFAISLGSNPLPIHLLSFKAKINEENKTDIYWSTATEKNNDYFSIERSVDLKNIEVIGKVNGSGNCSSQKNYSYVDENPLPGISYYRLKQTDFDGKFECFNWCAVNNGKSGAKSEKEKLKISNLFPNPFADQFTLQYFNPVEQELNIQLTDQTGRMIYAEKINVPQGDNSYDFNDKNGLLPGNYVLILSSASQKCSVKLIRNK